MKQDKITTEDALELALYYRKTSVALGDFRFANWKGLSDEQRKQIEDREWDLLNVSSVLITDAVGISLDAAQLPVSNLKKAVEKGEKCLKKVTKVKNILKLVGSLLALSGAIASKNPGAIVATATELVKVAKDVADTEKPS